jgi:hypothetical protein
MIGTKYSMRSWSDFMESMLPSIRMALKEALNYKLDIYNISEQLFYKYIVNVAPTIIFLARIIH